MLVYLATTLPSLDPFIHPLFSKLAFNTLLSKSLIHLTLDEMLLAINQDDILVNDYEGCTHRGRENVTDSARTRRKRVALFIFAFSRRKILKHVSLAALQGL